MAFTFNEVRNVNQPSSNAVSVLVYFYDDSAATFTTRAPTVANWDLFSDSAAVNDCMYFMIRNRTAKFAGLRFTLSPVMASTSHTIVWEYRKIDDTWATLTVTDGTSGFTASGDVTWTPPDDWGTSGDALNAVTGTLIVRARISAASGITEGGRNTVAMEYFNYAICQTTATEYDGGTITGSGVGSAAWFQDTTKSWTDGQLSNRQMMMTSGSAAGKTQLISWNVGNIAYLYDDWNVQPTAGDSYTICENFEDVYQADVSGGWGLVTKAGAHSYALKCNLELNDSSFGDAITNIEFQNDFVWYEWDANTVNHPHVFGFRLAPKFGLDKTAFGCSFVFNKYSRVDNRGVGFITDSEYSFSYGNRYILRYDDRFKTVANNLRHWMNFRGKECINDYFEGWRSVMFSKTSDPRSEVRRLEVCFGNSGIEQPFANFDGVRTHYNLSLGVFLTTNNTIVAPGFDVGQQNTKGTFARSPIQYFAAGGNYYIDDYLGPRLRPMGDAFGSTPNNFNTYWRSTFNCLVTDEKKQLIPNARIQCKDGTGTVVFNTTTGTLANLLASTSVSNGNTYSLTNQPSSPSRLRFSVSSFSDTSGTESLNARLQLTGTDENDNVIQEVIFLENIGNGDYFTKKIYKTISSSGISVAGFSGSLVVDTLGIFPKQLIAAEKWQATSDTTLVVTDYNPMTFRISRPGFDDVLMIKNITTTQDLHIPMKRSKIEIHSEIKLAG